MRVDKHEQPLKCSSVEQAGLALVATGFGYSSNRRAQQAKIVAELLPQVRDIRRCGSAALDLCMVAAGRVDAHFEHGLNAWDYAAGALIAEQAGAICDIPRLSTAGAAGELTLVSAPEIHAELKEILAKIDGLKPLGN